jgi:hypothetical protein
LNKDALLVASFSIYVALLDYKEPKAINNFIFPNLIGKNLFEANFFDTDADFNEAFGEIAFDFILGNPPWKSKKDDTFHTKYINENAVDVGRYEIAQTFLYRTKDFVTHNTVCALIVTSTIFYNILPTTKKFKRTFLELFKVRTLFDLSAVRKLVFESAISPAIVVIYSKAELNEIERNVVEHISVKPSIFLKQFKKLVIEKFDQKEILQRNFIDYDWMFKLALYGNTLDFILIKKLLQGRETLKDFVDSTSTLCKGDGILFGSPKPDPFDFLIGKPLVTSDQVCQYYTPITDSNKKLSRKDVYLEAGRREELFTGNHVLIKSRTKDESDIVVSFCEGDAVYMHNTYGISSKGDDTSLKAIYGYLISSLHTYFQFITSAAWGISTRPEIKFEEYLSFPFEKLNKGMQHVLAAYVDDFIRPIKKQSESILKSETANIPYPVLRKIDRLIFDAYSLNETDLDLIDYVKNVSIFQYQYSKYGKAIAEVKLDQLSGYIEIVGSMFNSLYQQYDEQVSVEVFYLKHFVAMNFKFEKRRSKEQSEEGVIPVKTIEVSEETDEKKFLQILSNSLSTWNVFDVGNETDLFVQKDIKGFEPNSFYIIKPNEYKCWHRAMAWYDASEIKKLIEDAEMELLTQTADV